MGIHSTYMCDELARINMLIAPCKDCEKKGCGTYHSECEKYLEYRRLKDEENEKLREAKKDKNIACDYIHQQTIRQYKRTKKVSAWKHQQ